MKRKGFRAYMARYGAAAPAPEPDILSADWDLWQRFMRRDCLYLASAVASRIGAPVGRLMRGDQLAHAFVILPSLEMVPDRWMCLDWSGVRPLKSVRDDLREGWGRLAFDYGNISPVPMREKDRIEILRLARTRKHVMAALTTAWPRVSVTGLHNARLRYLDVIDVT